MDETTRQFIERQRMLGESQQIPTDIEPYGARRAQQIAGLNAERARLGLPPLINDEDGNPELTERRRRRSEAFNRQERAQTRSGLRFRR